MGIRLVTIQVIRLTCDRDQSGKHYGVLKVSTNIQGGFMTVPSSAK